MTGSDEYDISGFMQEKGAIGLISQIDRDDGNIVQELESRVHVSPGVLSDRVDEAVEMDLLELVFDFEGDHGNADRYQLTRRGKKLQNELDSVGLVELYEEFFAAHQRLDEGEEEIKEVLADSDIVDPDWPYIDPAADDLR